MKKYLKNSISVCIHITKRAEAEQSRLLVCKIGHLKTLDPVMQLLLDLPGFKLSNVVFFVS